MVSDIANVAGVVGTLRKNASRVGKIGLRYSQRIVIAPPILRNRFPQAQNRGDGPSLVTRFGVISRVS